MDNSFGNRFGSEMRQAEKQNEREYQKEKEVARGGVVTRDFQFVKQKERVEQILQKPRTQDYLAALDMIDFLSSDDEAVIERLKNEMGDDFIEELREMSDDEIFEMITQAFHEEFAEMETNLDDELLGVLSKCFIEGCDCHAIDRNGHILSHYESDKTLPDDFERGRAVFRSRADQCQCVEIYRTCCRVISRSGEVEVVKAK